MQNWQTIWNKQQIDKTLESTLERLIAVDGFNSPFGGMKDSEIWMDYVERTATKLQIKPEDSLFEVGCGGGAFLYPFYQKGHKVAGIDYAPNLVKIAQDAMPNATINVGEALNITAGNQFNAVISNGVFLYFPDYNYAATVLQRMVKMASKSIGIFDVPDLSKKKEALAVRKANLGEAEYEEKYRGLDHLYYKKHWFEEVLATESVKIVIEDQSMQNYGNSKYRFNVFIYK